MNTKGIAEGLPAATNNSAPVDKPKAVKAEQEEPKPVTAPQPYKAAYERYFTEGGFDFEPGFKSGKLVPADKKELQKNPDVAKVFSYLREGGASITSQIKRGLIKLFHETDTKSFAVAHYTEGESDHRVYIWDKNGDRVGTYDVDDSGGMSFYKARAKK